MMSHFPFLGSFVLPPGMEFLGPFVDILLLFGLVDLALKGWALWRCARMEKPYWFIALLLINSLGVLPACFLLLTNAQYNRTMKPKSKRKR